MVETKIKFSDHAKDRIKERKIPTDEVLSVVKNPEEIITSFKNRKLFRRRVRGKMLEVVAVEDEAVLEIITAYYLEEQKYES